MSRKVRCMECGELVDRREATPFYDDAGVLVGYLCRFDAEAGGQGGTPEAADSADHDYEWIARLAAL